MHSTMAVDFAALDRELELDIARLDLGVTPLESLEAPAWWHTALGVAGGVAAGYGTVALFVWT